MSVTSSTIWRTTAGERLPTWNGELYLEYHRGTYTTQSRNKRANRKSEFLLHDAELLATLASLSAGYEYPATTLRDAWRLICLNQFHDIIPGSSVNAVYVDSMQQYAEISEMGTRVRDEALAGTGKHAPGRSGCRQPNIVHTLGSRFLVRRPRRRQADLRLPTAQQSAPRRANGGIWLDLSETAPLSLTTLRLTDGEAAHPPRRTWSLATTLLENDYLRVELNDAGDITRIFDKVAGREVLPEGAIANQFQAFEDRPMNWDAWDVDIFFDDRMWTADAPTSVEVVEAGPLHATIEIHRRILHSEYVQRISLAHNSPRLDFETTIDWHERHVLLKVAFPVDVLTPVATYEIQWGNVQRPTHRNTSWDWARFETCAQKWVDLSEGDYGVSVLNDCKYGHDIRDNVIRISLLRSPTMPDPEADQGEHRFAYSLLPHTGTWGETTIGAAYALNDPLLVADLRDHARRTSRRAAAGASPEHRSRSSISQIS